MNMRRVESMVAVAMFAAVAGSAVAADQATPSASGEQPKAEYWMMDHSPSDAKAMRLMTKPGTQAAQPSKAEKKIEYSTMGHSPTDAKAMRLMKTEKPNAKKHQGAVEYSMMGHSRADAKAMRGMKEPERTVLVGEGKTE
jgi:hypothetical protein